jgi:hypothetical protein
MFLNPLLVGGIALVTIPILLHLLMRPRPKHLVFPALRFIKQRHDVNRRQMRLRNWLLLLLRAGAIALLALALARPTVQATAGLGGREGPVAAALVIDTMPRMEYRHDNKTRLDVAREMAIWLLSQLPEDSQIAVLDSDTAAPTFQVDRGSANQRIERLEIKNTGEPLTKLAVRALDLLKTSELPRELYVFSDLAQAAWDDRDHALAEKLTAVGGAGAYVIDVGVENPQNYSLGEARLSGQTLAKNSPLSVTSELSSIGLNGTRVVESYILNAQGLAEKRSQEIIETKAGQSAGVEFFIGGLDVGLHQGYLRMVGSDALPADDVRYFTVEVRPPWRVLVAAPAPAEDYAFLFTEALAPQAFVKNGQARFECDVVDYDKLSSAAFEHYSAVCLLDPPPLADTVWQQLAGYAQGGGGVALFVGNGAQPVASFNSEAAKELLPAEIELQARYPDGDLALAPDDSQHLMLSKFRPLHGTIGWDAFPVYRYWQIAELADGATVAVPYANTQPAIIERTLGKGRVMLMTTPISESPTASAGERWNLLATGFEPWPFFMLENEMMLYLVGSIDTQLNYVAGQTAVVRLDNQARRPTYLLTTPSGHSERVSPDLKQNTILVSSTDEVGEYRVSAGGAREGVNLGFSVNLSPSATQLTRIDLEMLKAIFGETKLHFARNRDQIDREVSKSRVGRELFPYLAVLLVVFLGVEHVLANRFYRK